jgi:hypothetical protein
MTFAWGPSRDNPTLPSIFRPLDEAQGRGSSSAPSLPGLTRQSISFVVKMDGCAGLRRAEAASAAQAGQARA